MPDTSPLVQTLRADIDAAAAGATTVGELGAAPFAGTITAVRYYPVTTITGANTNSRTYTITNRGQAGAGVVNAATLAMVSGVNATAHDDKAITLSVAGNLVVAAGDVLSFESTFVGTGIAEPGGVVEVDLTRS